MKCHNFLCAANMPNGRGCRYLASFKDCEQRKAYNRIARYVGADSKGHRIGLADSFVEEREKARKK